MFRRFLPNPVKRRIGRYMRSIKRRPVSSLGVQFLHEVKSRVPSVAIRTIFDVGANIGITAIEFSDEFPEATIYAFEPSKSNFARLRSNIPNNPMVHPLQIALGSTEGRMEFFFDEADYSMSRIVDAGGNEQVEMTTIDSFCRSNGVPKIDLMKIDTEGFELQVLNGAKDMLSSGSIKIIKAECSCDLDQPYYSKFNDLCEFLFPFGYKVFGFYDQQQDVFKGAKYLGRFDVAFLHINS